MIILIAFASQLASTTGGKTQRAKVSFPRALATDRPSVKSASFPHGVLNGKRGFFIQGIVGGGKLRAILLKLLVFSPIIPDGVGLPGGDDRHAQQQDGDADRRAHVGERQGAGYHREQKRSA